MESNLLLVTEAGVKAWRARVDGCVLSQVTQNGSSNSRKRSKSFSSASEAIDAFQKQVRAQMAKGFAHLRDFSTAQRGDLIFDIQVPNRCGSEAFDLSPDGRMIAVGTTRKGAFGAQIHLVEVSTGCWKLVHEEPRSETQTFLHAVLWDSSGQSLIYALNGQTRRLDLQTGVTKTLASYQQFLDSNFNPFCLYPSWDGSRTRLLVFDAGSRIRVLGLSLEVLLEVSTASPTSECRSASLSYSGRLLALYRSSRFLIYGHQNALSDPTNDVEIWDVDSRTLVRQLRVNRKVHSLAFDPTETKLLYTHEFVQGPGEIEIDTGAELWHLPDPARSDRWATCFKWCHSPDGRTLAIGGRGLHFVDATSHAAITMPAGAPFLPQHVRQIVYSGDGAMVASGGNHGRIQVHRVS